MIGGPRGVGVRRRTPDASHRRRAFLELQQRVGSVAAWVGYRTRERWPCEWIRRIPVPEPGRYRSSAATQTDCIAHLITAETSGAGAEMDHQQAITRRTGRVEARRVVLAKLLCRLAGIEVDENGVGVRSWREADEVRC